MKIAHVRARTAPAGARWRLAAALADGQWLDLEQARRRLATEDPRLAHDHALFRAPLATLDAHLAAGLRIEALRALLEPFLKRPERAGSAGEGASHLVLEQRDLRFGPPILRPGTFRDFYAFEQHVKTMWQRRNQEVPEAWYRLPVFYFSNISEIRGPDDPVSAPKESRELDYELEVAALVDTPARDLDADRADEVVGGYCVLNDWSARDLQREETQVRLGPAKGKDFATSIGPWLVTPDELEDARSGKGYALTMTANVNAQEISRGSWSDIEYSIGEMLARASADVRLQPGDLIGTGTVGTGCLLEVKDERLGRYLQPGDEVVLRVDRLGELRNPVVERASWRSP